MSELLSTLISIDRTRSAGLSQQITEQLRILISRGQLPVGHVLPSSRSLSRLLGVSRNTITYAIEQLVAEGYITISQGRRPIVSLELDVANLSADTGQLASVRLNPQAAKSLVENGRDLWPPADPEPHRPLRQGRADSREFPHDIWARCLRRAARTHLHTSDESLNRPALQMALRNHLVEHRGIRADPAQLFFVPTAQAGLTLVAGITLNRGDTAWIESPCYPGARSALKSKGVRVVGLPLDEQGMSFGKRRRSPPHLIFTTPTHQFPTGRLMSVSRRLELLQLAEESNSWVVEDDYDGEFHFDERPVPSLQGLDRSNRVIYVGTFSKSTFADIRIGYVVVPPQWVDSFKVAQRRSGLLASIHIQHALADFIVDGHFLAHIRRSRRLYRKRRDYLVTALRTHVGDFFDIETPAGGMQLVAWCRGMTNDTVLSNQLSLAGVVARPVSSHFVGRKARTGLLLGFAAWNEEEIDVAVKILRQVSGDLFREEE